MSLFLMLMVDGKRDLWLVISMIYTFHFVLRLFVIYDIAFSLSQNFTCL